MEIYSSLILLVFVLLNKSLRCNFFGSKFASVGESKSKANSMASNFLSRLFQTNNKATNNTKLLKSANGRIIFFDILKGLAIIAVILIHVLYFYLREVQFADNYFFLYLNNLVRFAIPFFFVVSGILLSGDFSSKSSIVQFYKRKVFRILLPYIVVSSYISLFVGDSFFQLLEKLLYGEAAPPFYFVIVLFQLYLLYPLLHKYKENKLFLPVTFIISFIFFVSLGIIRAPRFPLFGRYLFFFAYGIARKDYFFSSTWKNISMYILIVLYLILTLILPGLYFNCRYFFGIALINVIFDFRNIIEKSGLGKVLAILGKNSLWIFLTHYLVSYLVFVGIASQFSLAALSLAVVSILSIISSVIFASISERIYLMFTRLFFAHEI